MVGDERQSHPGQDEGADNEAELVALRAPQGDQVSVHVVQEEDPLQLEPCRLLGKRPVRLGLCLRPAKCQSCTARDAQWGARLWLTLRCDRYPCRNPNLLGRYTLTASTPAAGALRPLSDADAPELDGGDEGVD